MIIGLKDSRLKKNLSRLPYNPDFSNIGCVNSIGGEILNEVILNLW